MALSERQWQTLRALMDRIIPEDDFPSASEAGVEGYFRRQFAGDLSHLIPTYKCGLDALEEESRLRHGADFAVLSGVQQDEVLAYVERGAVEAVWPISPVEFFNTAVNHTMEGFYADPGNGGNRDAISWKMVGYETRIPGRRGL